MLIVKATPEERAEYAKKAFRPVLYGWAVSKRRGLKLAIEYLGEGKDNPNYEIMAPDQHYFPMTGTHTLICFTYRDLKERTKEAEDVAPCTEHGEDGHGCEWAASQREEGV